MGDNVASAENQQATLRRVQGKTLSKIGGESSETTRQAPFTKSEILAYLQGALHDASLNKGKRIRFVQKYKGWLEKIQSLLQQIHCNSWIYKEGKDRNLYALETMCKELNFSFMPSVLKTDREKIMYMRGFFDAEGGVPRNNGRFYIQLVQKDYRKISVIKDLLASLGIASGKIHNPSQNVDPDYWRIFIASRHHKLFARMIGSWHPIKGKIFSERMMI